MGKKPKLELKKWAITALIFASFVTLVNSPANGVNTTYPHLVRYFLMMGIGYFMSILIITIIEGKIKKEK